MTTKNYTQFISSESIQEFIDNPSRLELPLKKDERIDIYLKEKTNISSVEVSIITMDVLNVGTTGIKGNVIFICYVNEKEQDIVRGSIVEVKL